MSAVLPLQLLYFSSRLFPFFVIVFKLHIPGCLPKAIWTFSKNGGCLGPSKQGEKRHGFAGNCFRENKRIGEEFGVLKPT